MIACHTMAQEVIFLRIGKIPEKLLREMILPFSGAKRREVKLGPGYGEDCAVLDLETDLVVASTDPITGAASGAASLAVLVASNDVAANGARPVGVLLCVLLPPDSPEDLLSGLIEDADLQARELGLALLGGHTEVTDAVRVPVITATALGRVAAANLVKSAGARPGDCLLLTKWAGLEGTAILATDFAPELAPLVGEKTLQEARELHRHLSVIDDGITAARAGASALHDVTEGGLLGAVAEVAAASGTGAEIWAEKVPVHPSTREICRALDIDPLRLISSGAMLIAAPESARDQVKADLERQGISTASIGRIQEASSGLTLVREGREERFTVPDRDELYRVLERFGR